MTISTFLELPTVDLEQDDNIADKIGEACRQYGFFYLKNHKIPVDLVNGMFNLVKTSLFSLEFFF
jgi:isopenicillin N synthase-like dioxygenase